MHILNLEKVIKEQREILVKSRKLELSTPVIDFRVDLDDVIDIGGGSCF